MQSGTIEPNRRQGTPKGLLRPRALARAASATAVAFGLFGLAAQTAEAGPTFVVNSIADVPAGPNVTDGICETATGNGVCTLRAAIMEANTVADSIVRLPAGFYALSRGTLSVLSPMTIEGDGPGISVVDGINLARVLDVANVPITGSVEVRGLTLQHGTGPGGGVRVRSPLVIENVHVKDNAVGSGILVESTLTMRHGLVTGNGGAIGDGGGIAVSGTGSAVIEDSRIERNVAYPTGGGIFANTGSSLRLERTIVARNQAFNGSTSVTQTGGGIEARGNVLLLNSLVTGNLSVGIGGGINASGGSTQLIQTTLTDNSGFAVFAANPPGSAIAVSGGASVSLTRSIVTSNRSECSGSIFSGDYNIVKSAADCPLFGLVAHNLSDQGFTALTFNGGFGPDVSSAGTSAQGSVPAVSCLDDLGAPLTTDLRGHRRKPPTCDRGAHDATAAYTPTTLLGINLLRNGGASGEELGLSELVANPPNVDLYQAPYWAQAGHMVQIQYGAPDGYPTLADAPAGSGFAFFAGGIDPVATARQVVDVSALAAQIDAGLISYDVTGAFGGYLTDDDRATLVVQFENELGITGLVTLGGFTAADRGFLTGLLADQRLGIVPPGTRFLDVSLTFQRFAGNANDGYADALRLTLPEPGLAMGLTAAIALLAALGRPRS